MKFLDQAKVQIRSGNGGAGCVSFRREKFVEFGGPDGGDGGAGGNIHAVCVAGLNTLIDYRFRQHVRARHGQPGMGKNRTGARGADAVLALPVGTQIFSDDGHLICDLEKVGQSFCLARGGNGGFGNTRFKSSVNRAPRTANPGKPGVETWVHLRLKLVGDAGIIGLPNAGKSTLLARVSAARPKIGDYPFTTLVPVLGIVRMDDDEFVLTDIPGLIEGAHKNCGLGHDFLGHVERTRVLLHLVDSTCAAPGDAWRMIRREIEAYGHDLDKKPEIVALSKCECLDEQSLAAARRDLADACGSPPYCISAHSGMQIPDLLGAARRKIRQMAAAKESPKTAWQP